MICTFAVWQSVEICHHSQAGYIWRTIAERLTKNNTTKYLGNGMSCPFCYSNWFGMLYVGCYSLTHCDPLLAIFATFIGGLAVARGANVLNDWMHDPGEFICRTPNKNPNSGAGQLHTMFEDEEPTGPAAYYFSKPIDESTEHVDDTMYAATD